MLENNPKLEVRKSIAAADDTSIDLLQQFSKDPDREVRRIVASNPNTPTEILLKLGEEFPEEITANPIFNLLLLENHQSYFIRLSLARSSTTSEQMLAKLAETREAEDVEICCAVASNPNTSIHVLEKLANWMPRGYQYFGSKVQICVANNLNTPTFVLEHLAGEWDESIRQAVLNHPNISNTAIEIINFIEEKPGTPIYILEKLASDNRVRLRWLVAEHPFAPVEILEKLAEDNERHICQLAIKHKNITPTILEQLIYRNEYYIWALIINHKNTTSIVLEKLTYRLIEEFKTTINFDNYHYSIHNKDCIISIFSSLIKHPRITANALLKLASIEIEKKIDFLNITKVKSPNSAKNYENFLIALAQNIQTPSKIIEKFFALFPTIFQNRDTIIFELASHPNMPVHLLRELAQHKDVRFRAAVARNPSTPSNLLRQFLDSRDSLVLIDLAKNIKTPVSILAILAKEKNKEIRANVATNISTPICMLQILAKDRTRLVRKSVTDNPQTSANIIDNIFKQLKNNWDKEICINIAKHPNTSFNILLKLAGETDYEIRKSLVKRPDISAAIIEKVYETTLDCIDRKNKKYYDADRILISIAKNANTSISILEQFVFLSNQNLANLDWPNYKFWRIQKAVASNINTPVRLLEKLTSHESKESVQRVAKKALQAKIRSRPPKH